MNQLGGLLIVGAGGHGRVVADAARQTACWAELAFLDDRFPDIAQVDGVEVLGRVEDASSARGRFPDAVAAMGDPSKRLEILDYLSKLGFQFPPVVHPSAVVSDRAVLGPATVVFALSAINTGASLGRGCIVNTGASVDHDCKLGAGVHVAPGARLGGNVCVGIRSWIGIGASVREGTIIGSDVTIGAGAAVVSDLPDGVTAVGVPARTLPDNNYTS